MSSLFLALKKKLSYLVDSCSMAPSCPMAWISHQRSLAPLAYQSCPSHCAGSWLAPPTTEPLFLVWTVILPAPCRVWTGRLPAGYLPVQPPLLACSFLCLYRPTNKNKNLASCVLFSKRAGAATNTPLFFGTGAFPWSHWTKNVCVYQHIAYCGGDSSTAHL